MLGEAVESAYRYLYFQTGRFRDPLPLAPIVAGPAEYSL